jgi:predicted amidohydrolase YtcJ
MKKLSKITFLVLFVIATVLATEARLAFINGKIYTVADQQPLAGAVVTEGNRIIFVGSTTDAQLLITDDARVIDLQGRLMLPGFIDDHVHFTSGGFHLLGVDLRPARSTAEFRQILKDYVNEHRGRWITGGNWDHEQWETNELPDKAMIDDFSPDTPILISRFDGHMALANSLALKLAGITGETPSPEDGLIVKDPETGEPTGMLKESAVGLVSHLIPDPTPEEYERATLRALQEARENGFTGVQDITYASDLKTYQELEKRGLLSCRIYTRLPIASYTTLVDSGITVGSGSDFIKLGSLKAFADGSLGSSTALFFEPYDQDPTSRGIAMDIVTDGRLKEWALAADRQRLQLSIHAIGDSANFLMLNMFEKIVRDNPSWDRRFRLEHAQHVRFQDIPRFAQLGVIASVQPYHCIDDGVWAEKRIGQRIKYSYPYHSFLEAGVRVCFGSDWPVAPLNALLGIYAAVTRRTLDGKNPNGWVPEQEVTVADAISCYTLNSAYAAFEENVKGSIEVGKLADLVVLNEDILEIDPARICSVKVDLTVCDGKIIYQRE